MIEFRTRAIPRSGKRNWVVLRHAYKRHFSRFVFTLCEYRINGTLFRSSTDEFKEALKREVVWMRLQND